MRHATALRGVRAPNRGLYEPAPRPSRAADDLRLEAKSMGFRAESGHERERVDTQPALAVIDAHARLQQNRKVRESAGDDVLGWVVGGRGVANTQEHGVGICPYEREKRRQIRWVVLAVGVDARRMGVARGEGL